MIILPLLLQSQTVCRPVLGQVVCETAKPAPQLDYQATMDRAGASVRVAPQSAEQRVARMVRDGNCDGAKRAALDAGDMDLATKTAQLCGK